LIKLIFTKIFPCIIFTIDSVKVILNIATVVNFTKMGIFYMHFILLCILIN